MLVVYFCARWHIKNSSSFHGITKCAATFDRNGEFICKTATDVVGVLNGGSRSAKKLGDNIWVEEREILQSGSLGSQWVHDLFIKKLLTNYSTGQPVWKATWKPSLEENVYIPEDLEFREEKNLKHLY